MSAPHSYESEAALPEQGDIEVGEMDLTVGAKQGRRRRLTTEAARRRAAHATSALAGDISLDVEVGSSEQGDGRDDDEDDYYYDDEDDYVQDDDDDREHGEHWDELGGTYEVPEGQRYCSGCRSNRKEEDFDGSKKTCRRHKKAAYSAVDPVAIPIEEFTKLLRAAAALDGVAKFDSVLNLEQVPGQDEVAIEMKLIDTKSEELRIEAGGVLDKKSITADQMKRTKATCRPFIRLVQEITGYSFVYKDARLGRKLKDSQALRYLCAQRTDQDGTKRKSAANLLVKKDAIEGVNSTLAAINALALADADLSAYSLPILPLGFAQNLNAVAGPSGLKSYGADNDNGEDEDDEDDDDEDGVLAFDRAVALGLQMSRNAQQEEANGGGASLDLLGKVGLGGDGVDDASDSLNQSIQAAVALMAGNVVGGATPAAPAPRVKPAAKPKLTAKGKVKGKGRADGKPRKQYVRTAAPTPIKRMERFDCRGSMIITILADGKTATVAITHNIHHGPYVDVVGNRHRGLANSLPSAISTAPAVPKKKTPAIKRPPVQLPPPTLEPIVGDTDLELLERTFLAMSDFVQTMKKRGEPEDEQYMARLLVLSKDLRAIRADALASMDMITRAGKVRSGRGGAKKNKRSISVVDGVEDEGARPRPDKGDSAADTPPCLPLAAPDQALPGAQDDDEENVFDPDLEAPQHDDISMSINQAIHAATGSFVGGFLPGVTPSITEDASSVGAWLDPALQS